jgi:hypothetical protein
MAIGDVRGSLAHNCERPGNAMNLYGLRTRENFVLELAVYLLFGNTQKNATAWHIHGSG